MSLVIVARYRRPGRTAVTLRRWSADPTVALATELPGRGELDAAVGVDAVVVVGPDEPADASIAAVVERLRQDSRLDAAARLYSVVDAIKLVSPDQEIIETVDRSTLAHAAHPMAVRAHAVRAGAIRVLGVM